MRRQRHERPDDRQAAKDTILPPSHLPPSNLVPSNRLRIIGGAWRSRVIHFPTIDGLRPTPDRVRETLFNWLGQDLTGLTVLDLFAGSGALAFEALSRGAAAAVAIESHPEAIRSLRANADALSATGLEIQRADAAQFLASDRRSFDVIFVDPPFRESWLPRLWPVIEQRSRDGGWVYVEQGHAIDPPAGWMVYRHRKAGNVHYHLLRRRTGNDEDEGPDRAKPVRG